MEALLALKAWGATKPLRRWAAWALALALLAVAAWLAYAGIRDGIAKANAAAYASGYAVGKAAADAECRNAYLEAVARAQSAGQAAELAAWRSSAARAQNLQSLIDQAKAIAHDARAPIPDGCPAADPRSVRLLADEAAGLRAALDRLQGVRPAGQAAAGPAGRR